MNAHKNRSFFRNFVCIYPAIKRWMRERNISIISLADGMQCASTTVYCNLSGQKEFKIYTIKRLLEYTGMTFEGAFGEEISVEKAKEDMHE